MTPMHFNTQESFIAYSNGCCSISPVLLLRLHRRSFFLYHRLVQAGE